jgi:cysteine desulfurase / selenocysteine lyase
LPPPAPDTGEIPMSFDVARIRADFPILDRQVNGHPLVYLDSANTSQKPLQVIDAIEEFYSRHNANIHRATHQLGEEATEAYEGARLKVAGFIGATDESEVVFTKNISEGINLVAYALGNASSSGPEAERFRVGPGDEIVITEMEHHSNIVPWQLLAQRTGATLRWFGVTDDGRLDLSTVDDLINERTKIVALAHQSNVLGTVNPVREIAAKAHAVGALVLVDGAQAVPQMPVEVGARGAAH